MSSLFIYNEQQRQWIEKIGRLADEFQKTAASDDEHGRFPIEKIQVLRDSGYTALTVPKSHGGTGISVYDMLLFQERLARGDAPCALSIGWHVSVMGELGEGNSWDEGVFASITEEVKQGAVINRAATEAKTGSPTRGGRPGTNAVKRNGKWIVNGRKTFTTMSQALDYFLVTAWVEEKETVGVFLIHKDEAGVSIEETWDMAAMRATGSHDLVLKQVTLDENKLVESLSGPRGKKPNGWLLHIPAVYLGIAQAARDYAVRFAAEYSPNSLNGPIKEVPAVKKRIGEMELELLNARHFLFRAAQLYDDPERRPYLKSELGAAKHIVTNTAISVVDKAMRIVGAKSLERTNPLQRYYRDVRAGLHNPPMDDAVIQKLASEAFDK
ncbi:acyl-CoA dehydrogenase family protein [Bacillus atrophaeus]|uniref:acyl-CoA dehydrogenase family protein n=1 Tax=Bacillus atrophaeus TaxID=1452 RepID=UPI002E1CDE07|nr:acyl-CoA/acyl-ACP dehydrogenase [Bacillus atrophaeus]MED4817857.1 acyl-CoA/acyl-ACP dehydrogenase [Bacillus atrophaeus]MED4825211.1 acyl-CoA/acyl-ACP dehydrogenase [Bacillus atrophaeus]MED4842085.1 acyl-CoA/acyl-ACP dehydrogenase [Bacillus atrophaeus]MED4861699.1 acyl-CoA/acyl-ACP dehydrogenase [Bacillus atrophaeus]